MHKAFQRCNRCVMDNESDNMIKFDSNGYCNYCTEAIENMKSIYFPNEEGKQKLKAIIQKIKDENKNKQYDCLMGISGGLDSAYLAYLGAVKWGLRIYAIHVDDGFNEPIAESNIQKLCDKANIKLIIEKPDSQEFNDLTRSFMLANVPNLAIPQDNIYFSYLYKHARKERIRYFLSGGNFSLESILQKGNTYDAMDRKHIIDIHKRYGRFKLNNIELLSHQQIIIDRLLYRIDSLRPLNLIDYNKERAIKELADFCNFKYYGSKHLENKLTKFVQLYWLVEKFNVDKRTSHLSSMIVSNQITRKEALEELNRPLYDIDIMENDINYILKRIDMSLKEFEDLMNEPPKQHTEYKTSNFASFYRAVFKIKRVIRVKQ